MDEDGAGAQNREMAALQAGAAAAERDFETRKRARLTGGGGGDDGDNGALGAAGRACVKAGARVGDRGGRRRPAGSGKPGLPARDERKTQTHTR